MTSISNESREDLLSSAGRIFTPSNENLDYDDSAAGQDRGQNITEKTGRCSQKLKSYSRCICYITLILGTLILVTIGLVFLIYFTDNTSSSFLTENDYVLFDLNTRADKTLTASFFDYDIVDLYKVKCSELSNYIEKKNSCPVRSNSIPSGNKTKFRGCSEWSGKCPIDQQIYLLKEIDVSITYDITVEGGYRYNRHIRFLVYDDQDKFNSFLQGRGAKEAIYVVDITNEVTKVIFGYNEMTKHASYYFFVIELLRSPANNDDDWFMVNRYCMFASYSGLQGKLQPDCTLGDSSSVTCALSFSLTEHSCIVGHSNGRNTVEIYWKHSARFYSAGIVLIMAFIYIPILIFILLFKVFLKCCIRRTK